MAQVSVLMQTKNVIFKHRYYKIHKKFYKYLDHIAGVEYKFRRNDLASSLSLHIGMKFGLGIFFLSSWAFHSLAPDGHLVTGM